MTNPFLKILTEQSFTPGADGPAILDESFDGDGNRIKSYVDNVRAIAENPAFEKEFKLNLKYLWHAMTKESYDACHLAAAMFNEFYKRIMDLADESKELDQKNMPEAQNPNEPIPPGEAGLPEGE